MALKYPLLVVGYLISNESDLFILPFVLKKIRIILRMRPRKNTSLAFSRQESAERYPYHLPLYYARYRLAAARTLVSNALDVMAVS